MKATIPVETWDHVVVRVTNLEKSLAFYREHFGFEPEIDAEVEGAGLEEILRAGGSDPLPGAKAHLVMGRVGGQLVELIEYTTPEDARGPGPGLAAFTLRIADADVAYAACQAGGISCDTPPVEIHGSRQFFIRDPDGTRIELTQPPPKV